MFEPEVFRKQMHCIEESTRDIVGTPRRPLQSLGAPCSDSAPPRIWWFGRNAFGDSAEIVSREHESELMSSLKAPCKKPQCFLPTWELQLPNRDEHYPVCRLDIWQDREFATGYGYPKTAFKRKPDTDPDIRNAFIDSSRIQTFGKSCTLHSHSFIIIRSIFSAFLLCHDFESVYV